MRDDGHVCGIGTLVVVKNGIYSVKKQGASYEHTPVWTRAPAPIIAAAGTSLVVEDPKAVP